MLRASVQTQAPRLSPYVTLRNCPGSRHFAPLPTAGSEGCQCVSGGREGLGPPAPPRGLRCGCPAGGSIGVPWASVPAAGALVPGRSRVLFAHWGPPGRAAAPWWVGGVPGPCRRLPSQASGLPINRRRCGCRQWRVCLLRPGGPHGALAQPSKPVTQSIGGGICANTRQVQRPGRLRGRGLHEAAVNAPRRPTFPASGPAAGAPAWVSRASPSLVPEACPGGDGPSEPAGFPPVSRHGGLSVSADWDTSLLMAQEVL